MGLRTIGFVFGTAFGFILGWARLTDYDVIRDMLLLRHADVFLLMMSAMVTAATGVRLLRIFEVPAVFDLRPVTWTVQSVQRRHVIGSVIFGLGWSLAGTCPGPVAAQLGRGQLAAIFTIAGILAGIALHDRARVSPTASAKTNRVAEPVGIAGL